ncbi:hypothetical protein ACFS07_15615 [Undibacterium arcticum]
MEPTPHAQDVILDVRATIAALEHALSHRVIFDAKKETREFKICMTDISEVVLLPRLLNYLSVEAPGICFDISKNLAGHAARFGGWGSRPCGRFHAASGSRFFYQQKNCSTRTSFASLH